MKKTVLIFLSFILVLGVMAACSKKEETTASYIQSLVDDYEEEHTLPEREEVYFESKQLIGASPFSEDIAWIQYEDGEGGFRTDAVNKNGQVLYTTGEAVLYAAPFRDGLSFLVVSDAWDTKEYGLSTADGQTVAVNCQIHTGDTITDIHEVIIDADGNELYSTQKEEAASSVQDEHILCYGDSRFVALRHSSGVSEDTWLLGTLDKDGNEVNAFKTYDFAEEGWEDYTQQVVDKDFMPDWLKWSDSTGRCIIGKYEEIDAYLGEGTFCLRLGDKDRPVILYTPDQDTLVEPNSNAQCLGKVEGGKVFLINGGPYVCDVLTGEESELEIESMSETKDGRGKWGFFDNYEFKDGMLYYNHRYMDINGETVLTVSDYADQEIMCSPFYHGAAVMLIHGADDNNYCTLIDENGKQLFEPMRTDSALPYISDGSFVIKENNEWKAYNVRGEYVTDLATSTELGVIWSEESELSEGYAFMRADDLPYAEILNITVD